MSFSHRYRDIGFMVAYIVFNWVACFGLFYLVSVYDWSNFSILPKKKAAKAEPETAVQHE